MRFVQSGAWELDIKYMSNCKHFFLSRYVSLAELEENEEESSVLVDLWQR